MSTHRNSHLEIILALINGLGSRFKFVCLDASIAPYVRGAWRIQSEPKRTGVGAFNDFNAFLTSVDCLPGEPPSSTLLHLAQRGDKVVNLIRLLSVPQFLIVIRTDSD